MHSAALGEDVVRKPEAMRTHLSEADQREQTPVSPKLFRHRTQEAVSHITNAMQCSFNQWLDSQIAKTDINVANYNAMLDKSIANYYATYVRFSAGPGCSMRLLLLGLAHESCVLAIRTGQTRHHQALLPHDGRSCAFVVWSHVSLCAR